MQGQGAAFTSADIMSIRKDVMRMHSRLFIAVRRVLAGAGMTALLCGAAQAQCMRQSPDHTVALLELYTSEGCDSCPPADKWLSGMAPAHVPHSVIPLSLHVTYWDYLGWKDRFADARLTERQQELTRLAKGRVVYTPGVFLNLREFRRWTSAGDFKKAVGDINATPARAGIRIALVPRPDGKLAVEARFQLKPHAATARAQAYLAVYENGLQTVVKAGENRGVTLKHDHVVRQLLGPIEFAAGVVEFNRVIVLEPQWQRANLGVAAFVQDAQNLSLLQATALKVCG
jgi:hypothetical protein